MSDKHKVAIKNIELAYYRLISRNWGDYYLKSGIVGEDKIKELVSEYDRLLDLHHLIAKHINWAAIDDSMILPEVEALIKNEVEKYDSIYYIRQEIKEKFSIEDEEESDDFYLASDFQADCLKSISKSISEHLSSGRHHIHVPGHKDPAESGTILLGRSIKDWMKEKFGQNH